ncbi:MAG: hydrogenase iron-sulfur subunit [Anaerolineales bacterium]|nr:hydrogenase iron-sulfur subunit [Anaerolineales bacterium]
MTFEPKIIAFLCTWCSYTGADSAGIARKKSPANIRAIRVPCSGRVSPELVMRAFDQGADGVLVLGCHIGECHYESGNHRTAKRLPVLQSLLTYAGLEPERLYLDWVSASEGDRFAHITTDFTERVRALGPARWRVNREAWQPVYRAMEAAVAAVPAPAMNCADKTDAIRTRARDLLVNGDVECVIGYEVSPHGRTRPTFVYTPDETERLVWNPGVSNNLTTYLPVKLNKGQQPAKAVAVVVKPCDSKAVNVMLAENQFSRAQVHLIGVTCEGVVDAEGNLQSRCQSCDERMPVLYDSLVGEPVEGKALDHPAPVDELEALTPPERMEYWLSQFDRCIRCYACRQACPMCNCPTCLYERDDSTYAPLGTGLNEKRTFHLGRAYHLAGRCVGCNECERACPMGIPISRLNQKLAATLAETFGHHAGLEAIPSPIVTVLSGEYKEG